MKIIEPIDNLGALSSSNAPLDSIDEWESASRDSFNYYQSPIFDTSANLMVIAESAESGFNNSITIVDLTTGIGSLINYQMSAAPINIDLSPNGLYVYILMFSSGLGTFKSVIIEVSTGSVKYEKTYSAALFGGFRSINNSFWADDSSSCHIGHSFDIVKVFTSTGFPVAQIYSGSSTGSICDLIVVSGHIYFAFSRNELVKITTSGVLVNSIATGLYYESFVYNHVTDKILMFGGSISDNTIYQLNTTTLAMEPSGISGSYSRSAKALKVTTTDLITRSLSTEPYWVYLSLSSYSVTKSLPPLPNPGQGISSADDFTVIQQSYGIALLDSNDVIIEQVNPDVVAGDFYTYNNVIYEVAINNSDQPDIGALLPVPTWIDSGPINPLRLFDGKLDSLTTSSEDLIIEITPAQVVSGIALFNITAASIRVTMTDQIDGLVFDTGDISMIDNSGVHDWWSFYFSPYVAKSDFVSLSLPPYPDAAIQVTLDGAGGSVAVGEVVLGRVFNLGISQFGSGVGILDFSEKEQDQFGNFSILKRKFSKRADYDVKIPTNTVSGAQRTLSKFRATPVVWVGDVDREETIIYGYFKSFDIVLSNPALSDTAILVEGL